MSRLHAWELLRLVLLFALSQAAGAQHVFSGRSDLLVAVDEWCTNAAGAEATYGSIAGWDVSGVRDMSYLFCGSSDSYYQSLGCRPVKSTCNPDISGWDVANVKDMRCARLCLGHSRGAFPSSPLCPLLLPARPARSSGPRHSHTHISLPLSARTPRGPAPPAPQ